MPASVPQPTGAPDTACRQRRPASPHRCVGCAPYSRVWRQRHGLKDCHTLCPDTGVGVPPQWAVVVPPQWRPGSPPTAWHRARLLPQPQCSRGRPLHPTRRLRLVPALPRSVGLGPIRSPQNVPCPSLRLPTAIPSPRHPTLRTPPQGLPTFGARHPSPPTVERCDEWCCRPQALSAIGSIVHPLRSRKMMPLSICRGSARLRPLALGGVFLQDDRFDAFPKLVRHFPDGL